MASTTTRSKLNGKSWRKDTFIISTDSSTIPIDDLINMFACEGFYWAQPLPPEKMREMLDNSLTFGVYHQRDSVDSKYNGTSGTDSSDSVIQDPSSKFIGLARCVTDFTTFLYLTDVWVDPSYQGHGLGSWLITCVQEVIDDMPHLRRSMLFTGDWERSVPFYKKLMGMEVLDIRPGQGLAVMESKGKGHPSFGRAGNAYSQGS